MNALWSPQQREWLQALGHDVLVLAGTATAPENAAAAVQAARPAPPAYSPAACARTDAALLRAVLRAAGRRDVGELAAWLPNPATLRGNAAAKRALWPRLRTLRKQPDDA